MGIKDFLEEAAGAVAAEQGLKAIDPNANVLEEGVAALAGFEGVNLLKEHFGGQATDAQGDAAPVDASQDQAQDQAQDAGWDDSSSQSDDSQNN